jgi:hypothetical protein
VRSEDDHRRYPPGALRGRAGDFFGGSSFLSSGGTDLAMSGTILPVMASFRHALLVRFG